MLRGFMTLHKGERRILLVVFAGIAAIIAIFVFVPLFRSGGEAKGGAATTADSTAVHIPQGEETASSNGTADGTQPTALRHFDPNTADSTALRQLGLSPAIVRNIYKYREKGGVFMDKEDFARLYGLTAKKFLELEPYIDIAPEFRPASTLFEGKERESRIHTFRPSPADSAAMVYRSRVKLSEGETVSLTTADTSELKKIPGIGSYYARRIVDYRQRLGGYVSIDQLDEIEDFPSEAKKYIALGSAPVRKINVNTMKEGEMKKHPYINFYQARAIADYRRTKGRIESLDDLRLLPEFTPEAIARLLPYVEY